MTTVLCVPQWQGSAAETAALLPVGARRTADLLPCESVVTVAVSEFGGEIVDGVSALDILVENTQLTHQALADLDDFVVTVGGDCGVDLAPITAVHDRYGAELTVLWIDAHPDVYGPGDLRSGAFHGMVVRTLLGDGPAMLTPARPLPVDQIVLAGVRAAGASEREYLRRTGLRVFGPAEMERAFETVSGPVYVHVDLDVLDPAEFGSVGYPEPDGVRCDLLIDLISQLDMVVGAAITEHAPQHDSPRETILLRELGDALIRP
ncbi:arginase family protein [Fodinicola feengrottensis]|uniref:Arginase family protein n=1 Tax=Fodinicola feengrottensis TaxID=435914 RepID=A0ABN2J5U8_9ACTN|nr:arginase family protein [Fodinicola feengrottensis]